MIMMIGFIASRFSSNVTVPVTPGEFLVAANASQIAAPSSEPARQFLAAAMIARVEISIATIAHLRRESLSILPADGARL